MYDPNSAQFKQSLSETIAWCAGLTIVADVKEPAEVLHRRALTEQAGRLMQKAHERTQKGWFLNGLFAKREYKRAAELLSEADPGSIAPLRNQLRSQELNPRKSLTKASEIERGELVREVVTTRSVRLAGRKQNGATQADFGGGRLLLYVPEENLADGAASYLSQGFFDGDNTPPWDIWVDYADRTLVSWVPTVLVELVEAGIEANIEGCIRWAE
jgi:hypothetical protein